MSRTNHQPCLNRASTIKWRAAGNPIPVLVATVLCVWLGFGAPAPAVDSPASTADLRFDFETGDLQPWRVVEGGFENPVSGREVFHNVYPEIPGNRYNKQGRFYLSTVERKSGPSNDEMTGVLESPVFVLDGPEMSFLVGGGQAENVYVALCTLAGQEVLKTRGGKQRLCTAWHGRRRS